MCCRSGRDSVGVRGARLFGLASINGVRTGAVGRDSRRCFHGARVSGAPRHARLGGSRWIM